MSNDMSPHEALTRVLSLGERYQVEELVLTLLTTPCSKGQFRPMHSDLPTNLRFLREEVIILERAREAVQLGSDGRVNEEVTRLLTATMLRSLKPLSERQEQEKVSRLLRRAPITTGSRNLCAYYAECLNEAFHGISHWRSNDALREKWLHSCCDVRYAAEHFQWEESPLTGKPTFRTVLPSEVPATLYLLLHGTGEALVTFTVDASSLNEPFTHALQGWPRPLNWREVRHVERTTFDFSYAVKLDTAPHVAFLIDAVAKSSLLVPITVALREVGVPVSDITMELAPCGIGG
ncbi:hypothetical protein HY624_03495 [Candidatus Uhrbacteria bacterium]|nr:hypothetical protein [Candidatus Uhrbacteria bacterium]